MLNNGKRCFVGTQTTKRIGKDVVCVTNTKVPWRFKRIQNTSKCSVTLERRAVPVTTWLMHI